MTDKSSTIDIASFLYNVNAFSFHYGLQSLSEAYRSARDAPERTKAKISEDLRKFEDEIKSGGVQIEEPDEDGFVYDHGEQLSEMMHDAEETLRYIREAFVVSLAHAWERRLPKIMYKQKFEMSDAYDFLRKHGGQPDENELHILRLTANVLKHSSGGSAKKLIELRPTLFDVAKMKSNGAQASYEYILIDDRCVAAFFNEVEKSVGR